MIMLNRPPSSQATRGARSSGTRSSASAGANSAPLHTRRGVVIGAAFAAMILAALGMWAVMNAVGGAAGSLGKSMPVREVVFLSASEQPLVEVDENELKRIADALRTRRASMLQLNLTELKAEMKQVAWVRDAVVQRRFPGTIVVAIEEHKPAALWTAVEPDADDSDVTSMVNSFGEVFRAEITDERRDQLPVLVGPDGTALEVLQKFASFIEPLKPIARSPRELTLTPRRAWQLTLDNGAILQLGRSELEPRLARFVSTYAQVPALQADKAQVDLRYQAGFTIKGVVPPASVAKPAVPRRA